MNSEFYNQVTANAVDVYGKNAQVDQAIEEMSELTKALLKERRTIAGTAYSNKKLLERRSDIIEEMADVKIMLDQLEYIFSCFAEVKKIEEQKINRLAHRVEEYRAEQAQKVR